MQCWVYVVLFLSFSQLGLEEEAVNLLGFAACFCFFRVIWGKADDDVCVCVCAVIFLHVLL